MKKITALLALTTILLGGCATKEHLESKLDPSAQADVTAHKVDNDNTQLNVSVKHLAPAERLAENANQYIVWVAPEGSNFVQNVGSLKVNDNLEGRHETTIPYKNFRVFVTPESSQVAVQPSGPVVFDKTIKLE